MLKIHVHVEDGDMYLLNLVIFCIFDNFQHLATAEEIGYLMIFDDNSKISFVNLCCGCSQHRFL